MRKWTDEQVKYLKKIYLNKSDKEITDLINKKFNTNYTKSAINSKKGDLGLKSHPLYFKYSQEIVDYIIQNHKGKSLDEIADEVNKKFGLNINKQSIGNLKSRLRRNNIFLEYARNDGCFKKGNVPINKGTKGMFNVGGNRTSFKKGGKSWNCDPIGTEKWKSKNYKDDEGFLYVKVQDGTKQHNWKQKHRIIWEEAYGEIPKGYKVIFKDGNRHNITLENLALVSNSEMLILNSRNLIYNDSKLTDVGINIAKVIDGANKKARK